MHLPPPMLSLALFNSPLSPPYLEVHSPFSPPLLSTAADSAPLPSSASPAALPPAASPSVPDGVGVPLYALAAVSATWQQWERVSAVSIQPQGDRPAALPTYCTAQAAVLPTTLPASTTALTVQVNQVPVGQVATADQAAAVARQLHQVLPQLQTEADHLRPVATATAIGGMVHDQAVVDLTPALGETGAEPSPHHKAQAIQWVNNLRQAVDADPLTLGEMQMVVGDFDPTAHTLQGIASWYGPFFHGRQTATGEVFDQHDLTAAHPSLPFGTYLKVRNLLNDRTVVVRVNDRGPYVGERSLDLSYAAAQCLDSTITGVVPYEATVVVPRTAPVTVALAR